LHAEEAGDEEEVAGAADSGLLMLGADAGFAGHKNIDFTQREFRDLAKAAAAHATPENRQRADLLAALASDACTKASGDQVSATVLCAMFGQGHQDFLKRLEELGTNRPVKNTGAPKLCEALFRPWRYEDGGRTLRWDPAEDRRYALAFEDPGGEKIRTVAGANRLAAVGIVGFPCSPTSGGLRTRGFGGAGGASLTWPLWSPRLRLPAVGTLMSHPELLRDAPRPGALEPLGVVEVMRARRISVGQYLNFEPARPLWGRTA
jgi:hypothetical protein